MQFEKLALYREKLWQEINLWPKFINIENDSWWPCIECIPAFYGALITLLQDSSISQEESIIVRRVIKYLISPLDLMPELIYGLNGYRDDLYLISIAIERWHKILGAEILEQVGLSDEDDMLIKVRELALTDLSSEVRTHLQLLIQPEAIVWDNHNIIADYYNGITEGSNQIVKNERYKIIFGGPGTGKTYRIVEELIRLLINENALPESIVVNTLTDGDAINLREQLRTRLLAIGGYEQVDQSLQRLTVSTIHTFCHSIMSEFHHQLFFLKEPRVLINKTDRLFFLFCNFRGELALDKIYPKWKDFDFQHTSSTPKDLFHFFSYVGKIYDLLSEDVINGDEENMRMRYLAIVNGKTEIVDEQIIQTYPSYWQLLQQQGSLDNSMILACVDVLLNDPYILNIVQQRYRHLLVDEYQDINPIHDRIYRKLTGNAGTLFAVADENQSMGKTPQTTQISHRKINK